MQALRDFAESLQSASSLHPSPASTSAQYPALPVVVVQNPLSPREVVQGTSAPPQATGAEPGLQPPESCALHFFLPFLPLHTLEQQDVAFLHGLPTSLQPGPAVAPRVTPSKASALTANAEMAWRRD